jgi:hypothetical protein
MTILKCGLAAILTLTSVYSVAMGAADHWMLWAEGAPPNWAGIKSWVSNQTTLPCDKLVIRLLDPDAANGSGDDFKLSGGITVEVLAFIKEIRGAGFTGEISMLPYFTGDWVWTPDGVTINNEWEKPFYWCIQANQILMAAGVSQGVFEVNFENENSAGILQVMMLRYSPCKHFSTRYGQTFRRVGVSLGSLQRRATHLHSICCVGLQRH